MSKFSIKVSDTTTTGPYLARLITEIDRIEKERKADLKFFNVEKQKFRSKYPKIFNTNFKIIVDNNNNNNKENVDNKVTLSSSLINQDYECIQNLLFTNGEIDIDKIICLHLLSIHKAEHLVKPKIINENNNNKALERILERSNKKLNNKIKASTELPSYVIDINKKGQQQQQQQQRLQQQEYYKDEASLHSRLLINEKVSLLIRTVMVALESVNMAKVESLIQKIRDPEEIRKIFQKEEIQKFFKYLKTNTLLLSCDSFVLSHSFKVKPIGIDVKPSKILEGLIQIIRKSVLQLPLKKWQSSSPASDNDNDDDDDGGSDVSSKVTTIKSNRKMNRNNKNKGAAVKNERINYIERNIENIAKASHYNRARCEPKRNCCSTDDCKFHLKQTTCAACMEKWKIPLPTPKTPELPKKLHSLVKTDSLLMLSNMINAELVDLESYDRRFSQSSGGGGSTSGTSYSSSSSSASGSSRSSRFSDRLSRKMSTSEDFRLARYDLEKIKNDIRSRETRRKLDEFLCNC